MFTRTKRLAASLFATVVLAAGVLAPNASAGHHGALLDVDVVITNLDILNNNTVTIDVRNVQVGAAICAAVFILAEQTGDTDADCDVVQTQ